MSAFFFVVESSTRLLFVDDDPIVRALAVANLGPAAASVTTAEDGRDALDQIARTPFDLILLDLEMPRLDGFGVLARLRADPLGRDLPVIVQTARDDVEAIDKAFRLGASAFVIKPLNWRLLIYQIRFVLRASAHEGLINRIAAGERAA